MYMYHRLSVLKGLSNSAPGASEVNIPVDMPPLPAVKSYDGFVDNSCLEEVEKKGPCDFVPDNRTLKAEPNGITPPIDGEYFVIKRGFIFRKSTVRMLNELINFMRTKSPHGRLKVSIQEELLLNIIFWKVRHMK